VTLESVKRSTAQNGLIQHLYVHGNIESYVSSLVFVNSIFGLSGNHYPDPKIQDLLLKLEGNKYATSLDLNMEYYHMSLTPFSTSLCTIVLPHENYKHQRLPMGLYNSPENFKNKCLVGSES
jgi:hypothetical protein